MKIWNTQYPSPKTLKSCIDVSETLKSHKLNLKPTYVYKK